MTEVPPKKRWRISALKIIAGASKTTASRETSKTMATI
jgi:hypothetical protein